MTSIVNHGTGAGGANTNINGLAFEEKTNNYARLLTNGFVRKQIPGYRGKYSFFLEKILAPTASIIFLTQGGLKEYFAHFHQKELFRNPDEAYLFRTGDSYTLKILEKKNQNAAGSVDSKLLLGSKFIEEYKWCLGEGFSVKYAFCVSDFLKKEYLSEQRKYQFLRENNAIHGVEVMFGDDTDYFTKLDAWISA